MTTPTFADVDEALAQRRQGLVEDAEATASSGMRLHPRSAEIARELTLCLVDKGRYDEALPVSEIATDGLPNDVELLMAYGRMLKRVTFALDKAWIFAIFAGFGCGIGYVATLRVMTDELALTR